MKTTKENIEKVKVLVNLMQDECHNLHNSHVEAGRGNVRYEDFRFVYLLNKIAELQVENDMIQHNLAK